jgi:hypothetical protein
VWRLTLKTFDFVDISNTLASNTVIPTTLGGSATTLSPIVAVILRQQLAYLYIFDRTVYAAPHKSNVFLFRESIIIYFSLPRVDYYLLFLCSIDVF